ncbi:DUF563 domain-containing protein [Acidiphilium sp. AL]|uniref:glycosyltransferase family 61 protein n=1 Tax=Acidiphilium sp. AL TaxID=2871704 RepID=UPI0021CB1351|nr:glycosyltransferase family 61 protein [Acidiphilium sp. AL]
MGLNSTTAQSGGWSGLVRLGDAPVTRIRLAGAAMPRPLPRLCIDDVALVAEHWVQFHADGMAGEPFDLASLGPMAVRLNGPGLIWRGGALLDDDAIMPVYVKPVLEKFRDALVAAPCALPVRRDGRTALVFHGWGIQVFGHFLIEMLPKLLLARRFPAVFGDAMPVLDRAMPDWLLRSLDRHFGIGDAGAIWFDSRSEQLDLDRAIILPLVSRAAGYHPAARAWFAEFAARIAVPPSSPIERLFVARGEFSNPAAPNRVLANEAELADIAARAFGFSVVHPETLEFAEQVGRFSQARVVLGQAGSGMHNALFAPEGAAVGVIRFTAPDQSHIAALRGQRIAYFTEGVAETAPGVFRADAGKFRRFVAALCGQP